MDGCFTSNTYGMLWWSFSEAIMTFSTPVTMKYPPWSRGHSMCLSTYCVWQQDDPSMIGMCMRHVSRKTRRSVLVPSLTMSCTTSTRTGDEYEMCRRRAMCGRTSRVVPSASVTEERPTLRLQSVTTCSSSSCTTRISGDSCTMCGSRRARTGRALYLMAHESITLKYDCIMLHVCASVTSVPFTFFASLGGSTSGTSSRSRRARVVGISRRGGALPFVRCGRTNGGAALRL